MYVNLVYVDIQCKTEDHWNVVDLLALLWTWFFVNVQCELSAH